MENSLIERSGLYIIIDNRERTIFPYLELHSNKLPYFVEHMTTGDIAICFNGNILIIIERKTWKDLAASLRDGRKMNIEKLKKLRDETNCHVAYLIEGDPCPPTQTKFSRIPFKNLRSHLDHLAFRDNVHMIYSKSEKDTPHRIFELARNYMTINPLAMSVGGDKKNTELLSINQKPSDELIIIKMWCTIPCVTDKNVHLFSEYKIIDILSGAVSPDSISILKYPSGVLIGKKRAVKIISGAKSKCVHIKVLSAIPGVTKLTAEILLEDRTLIELSKMEPSKISEIKKKGNRKLGIVLTNKIIKFIRAS